MAHTTLIGGTTYEISGGKTIVDGTAYGITGGRTLVDGTGYDISFGQQIGSLAVGTSVYMNYGGSPREYMIVQQGNPSTSKYDASCDGTWLLQKNVLLSDDMGGTDNEYANSWMHKTYLNSTYLGSFDTNVKNLIKNVKIPYVKGTGQLGSLKTGSNGLSTYIFLLSTREVGLSTTTFADGVKLKYFEEGSRVAYNQNNAKNDWWLRTPSNSNMTQYVYVTTGGSSGVWGYVTSVGIRPAFILPSETMVDSNFKIIA